MIPFNLLTRYPMSHPMQADNDLNKNSTRKRFVHNHSNENSVGFPKRSLDNFLQEQATTDESQVLKKRKTYFVSSQENTEFTSDSDRFIKLPGIHSLLSSLDKQVNTHEPNDSLRLPEIKTILEANRPLTDPQNNSLGMSLTHLNYAVLQNMSHWNASTTETNSNITNSYPIAIAPKSMPTSMPTPVMPSFFPLRQLTPTFLYSGTAPIYANPSISSARNELPINNLPRHLRFLEQQNPNASVRFIVIQQKASSIFEMDYSEKKSQDFSEKSLQLYQKRDYKMFIEFPNDKIKNVKLNLIKNKTNFFNITNENENSFYFFINHKIKLVSKKEQFQNIKFRLHLEIETVDARKIEEYSAPFSLRKQLNTGKSKGSTFLGQEIPVSSKVVKSYKDLNTFI